MAEAPGTLNRLLPVIRFDSEARRSIGAGAGIAIYADEIVLFHPRRQHIFPEAAYQPGGIEALIASRCCKGRPVRIPIAEVTEATLKHPRLGSTSTGKIKTAKHSYRFDVKTAESAHVQQVLGALLGGRFTAVREPGAPKPQTAKAAAARTFKPPTYSKGQARLLRLLAIPAGIILGASLGFLIFAATSDDGARAWGVIGGVSLAGFIIYQMLLRAYHLGLTPASELLATDRRPPILYLRSFQDDGKNNLHPVSEAAGLFGFKNPRGVDSGMTTFMFPVLKLFCYALRIGKVINLFRGIRTRTAEEEFAMFFRTRGPFIAIGRPGEKLAEGGAARLYVGHDEWQQKVSELLPRCQAVVLQPEETEGVWWEIVQLVQAVPPEKVLFCLVNYAGNQQRYEEFRIKFEDMTGIALPRMIGRYMFLYFGSRWAPYLIESRYRSEFTWPWLGEAIDFNRTLGPFFNHTRPPAFTEKDHRFSGLGWLAVATYVVLSLLVLIGVPLSAALLARYVGGTP